MSAVMDNYQYRVEDEKGRFKKPEVKDFRRLNKVVLKEGATNAAVSFRVKTNFLSLPTGQQGAQG